MTTANPYGRTPTPEGALLLRAVESEWGIECRMADARSGISKFYIVRNNMLLANPAFGDLQFKIMNQHVVWIMRKTARQLTKGTANAPQA